MNNPAMANNNYIDPWEGMNSEPRIEILFVSLNGQKFTLRPPKNITIKELIQGFFKMVKIENQNNQNIKFMYNGKELNKTDSSKIEDIGYSYGSQIVVIDMNNLMG